MPRILPWFIRFALNSNREKVERISDIRRMLLNKAIENYSPLLAEAGESGLIQKSGLLHVYESEQSYKSAAYSRDICLRRGIEIQELSGDEVRQMEPAIGEAVARAIYLPQVGQTVNPYKLTRTIADLFVAKGGKLIKDEARGFEVSSGKVKALRTSNGKRKADIFVLAAGAFSRNLSTELGCKTPLEAEWGYHILMTNPDVCVTRPILLAGQKIAITPMENGLQMTTLADFAGLDPKPDYARAERIFKKAKPIIPGLNISSPSKWRGPRPSMPDSLPVIGRCPGMANAILAYGHGHLGMALGPLTGKLVTDLALEQRPEVDISALRPDRF